ncbi:MAG: hypothetical protein M1825_004124 [Sarcosagium campestre]|nr:MAG: hypothetical protein M1825_004124 [Sarcosagium campestre]
MSLEPPTYLLSLQNNIRGRPIPWEAVVRAGHITDADLKKIRSVDKVRKEQRRQTVEADIPAFEALLLGGNGGQSVLDSAAKRVDAVQYILVLTRDLIDDVPSLLSALAANPRPYKPFLPLLSQSSNPEDPTPLLASSVLTRLISSSLGKSKLSSDTEEATTKLFTYLSALAKSSDSGLQDIAVQEYSSLLRTRLTRELFWRQRTETISPLVDILKTAAGIGRNGDEASTLWSGASSIRGGIDGVLSGGVGLQLLYHVLLVLWQLSFEGSLVGQDLEREYQIVPLYTQLLRYSPKEKTTRLLLSTLLNLLSANSSSLLPASALARLPALLTNLRGRHLTDADLLEDLDTLTAMLDEYTKTQTTFDQYAAEVRSGHLHWSPPHRSADFWRENARRVLTDAGAGDLPRLLADIAAKQWQDDKQVLAVACSDVGNLVKAAPELRYKLEKLGLKARVMELMTEPDESVRWESLRAVGEWMRYSFET